jgi:hypothetical protein
LNAEEDFVTKTIRAKSVWPCSMGQLTGSSGTTYHWHTCQCHATPDRRNHGSRAARSRRRLILGFISEKRKRRTIGHFQFTFKKTPLWLFYRELISHEILKKGD